MSEIIHARVKFSKNDEVILKCNKSCDFMLLSDAEFNKYQKGKSCKFLGGTVTSSPAKIVVPRTANWNIVVEPGGKAFKYELSYITN